VRAARDFRERKTAMAEFSDLCRGYWYPLYGFARRKGHSPEQAADHTQDFFVILAHGEVLAQADPAKGRLRTFFLTVFSRQLAIAHERGMAAKRGGGMTILALDRATAETRLAEEPRDLGLTPECWYDRQWALTLLERCLHQLAARMAQEGREQEFAVLRPFISLADIATVSSDAAAQRLGISAGTVRQKVSRLRAEFRMLLETQVAELLATPTPELIAEEIRALRQALRPPE
jgi:RNA polymerase sigma-70 factor (ECF subfamily)